MRYLSVVFVLTVCPLFVTGCSDADGTSSATSNSAVAVPIGALCEVTLNAEWLQHRTGYVTPKPTHDNANGSKDSAWGRLVSVSDDWVVLDAANISMDVKGGRQTTYGTAGENEKFEFWIPRTKVLYMQVWTK